MGSCQSFSLPRTVSVFTTELYAILRVLRHLLHSSESHALIVTDSASSLAALQSRHPASSWLIPAIRRLLTRAFTRDITIRFLWVPSHVGVPGNERADEAAKIASAQTPMPRFKVPASDLKAEFNQLLRREWQARWAVEPDCFLKRLRPSIGKWESSSRRDRREEVSLTRLRIGHCHATHAHFLNSTAPNMCPHWQPHHHPACFVFV